MNFDFDDFKGLLTDLVEEIADDGIQTARDFWTGLEGQQLEEAKTALKRYGENNLEALRNPAESERWHASAAHNMNTLINLSAGTKIEARREARALMDRVMARVFDTAESIIDAIL